MLLRTIVIVICSIVTQQIYGQDNPNSVRGAKEEPSSNKPNGNQYALVVGVSKYNNIQPLLYADDDAIAFKNFLIDTKLVPQANLYLLIDSTATRSRFYAAIKKIMDKMDKEPKENDRVIIYFAGHGDVDNDIDAGFLLGYNCEATPYAASDAIDIAMLERYVDAITKKKAKVVLITDACRSGKLTGGTDGAEHTLTALSSRFKNTVKILSCEAGQLSQEKDFRGGGHGIFTYYLLQALYGLADEDNNNIITKGEIEKFIKEKVPKEATGGRQNPIMSEGNTSLEMFDVLPELKQAMIAKMKSIDNNSKVVAKRSFEEKKYSGLSPKDSLLIKTFYNQIKVGKLNSPRGDNAYESFLAAKKTFSNTDLVNSMKYDLAAALEDDVQPLLNRVTRGEFQDTPYELFDTADKKLDIIRSELITPTDYRYNDIKALQIYFKRAGYFTDEALHNLLLADSILPNTAFINCEIARCYAKGAIPDTINALKYLRKSMRLAPTWPFPHLIAGLLYLDLNMYEQAKKSFEKSLSIKNDFKLGLINMGVVYSRLKYYEEEINYYKKALQIEKPYTPVLFSNIGLYWMNKEKYDSALYYNRKGYYVDPYNIFNLSSMIKGFMKIKQTDSAHYYLERLQYVSPVSYEDYRDMGNAYLDVENYNNAVLYYKDALAIKEAQDTYNNIGLAYEKLNKNDEAKKYYKLALRIKPDYTFALANLSYLYKKEHKYDSAVYYQRKLYSLNPKNMAITAELISLFSDLKQADSALLYLQKLKNYIPADQDILLRIADAYFFDFKDYNQAISYYNKALAFKPVPRAFNNIAVAYKKEGKIDEAIKYYKKAIEADPYFSLSINNLADVYYSRYNYDSAIIYYKQLIDISTPSSANYNYLADAFFSKGNYQSAIPYYKKAIALDDSRANYFVNLGTAHFYLQQYAESVPYLKKALSMDTSYTFAYPKLAYGYLFIKRFDEAIELYNKSLVTDTSIANHSIYYYNMACGKSMLLKKQEALPYFEKALQSGYLNLKHIEQDPYLHNIRDLTGFRKIIEAHFKREEIEKYPDLFISR